MKSTVHANRRQKVLDRCSGAPLLLRAAPEILRNGDVHHPYRQDSNFWYLTGFDEPESLLLALPGPGNGHRTLLFVRPRDRAMEVWLGKRAGVTGAKRFFGAEEAHPIGEFWKVFEELSRGWNRLAFSLGVDPSFDSRLLAHFGKRLTGRPRRNQGLPTIMDPRPLIHELRQLKSREEIELIQQAADITAEGHRAAMALAEPGMYEYEVQSELEAVFRREGSPRNGYPSIVASGNNANTLHYISNDRKMKKGDLLLIDAAAEFGYYSADVTRTFPVGGRFTEAQKKVYKVVLRTQKKCIRAMKPGVKVSKLHELARRELTKGMMELRVLRRGRIQAHLKKKSFLKWYMHGIGHWLGMDVHDSGAYETLEGKPLELRPGMVMTVEPGLYFNARDRSLPRELRGIGVRIEDDILVTRGGHRNLTAAIPKEIREVEALTAG